MRAHTASLHRLSSTCPNTTSPHLHTPPYLEIPLGLVEPGRKEPEPGPARAGDEGKPSQNVLEEGKGDVTITTNSLNKKINSGQSSAPRA